MKVPSRSAHYSRPDNCQPDSRREGYQKTLLNNLWEKCKHNMKYQYFISSRWRNKEAVIDLANKIRGKGRNVYCFLEGDGAEYELKKSEENHDPEEFMQMFESIPEWRHDPRVREIFDVDMQALKESETLILLLPAGKSSHLETGIAYGMGKKCILVGEQQETESLYLIFNEMYSSIENFITSLKA